MSCIEGKVKFILLSLPLSIYLSILSVSLSFPTSDSVFWVTDKIKSVSLSLSIYTSISPSISLPLATPGSVYI